MKNLLLTAVCTTLLGAPAFAVTIDWVTVGDAGNAADAGGFGAVATGYRISKFEVTNTQYAEFLNAVGATDPNALYNFNMAQSIPGFRGGITRSGSSGAFTYSVIGGRGNMPVNYVSFWDSLRFANWLHNGQPTGAQGNATTEDGAYTITAAGIMANSIARNAGATIFLTSEDEWYKAAYYDAVSAIYFSYPGASICAAPGATPDTANCTPSVGVPSTDVTDVGSYTASPSPNGTFDQGGNVWEWNETITTSGPFSFRVLRGGPFNSIPTDMKSSFRLDSFFPVGELINIGFRVATLAAVPEPGPGLLLMMGMLGLVYRQRRRASGGRGGLAVKNLLLTLVCATLLGAPASAVTIDWVTVGDPGNAPDTEVMTCCGSSVGTTGYGSVPYVYRISKFETTNAQYVEFLNAKAAADPLALYDPNMAAFFGGITQSGTSGAFTYSVSGVLESWPVHNVSFYNALRFANWLHNGQGSGDTETGAYTLLGGTATPSNGLTVTRNAGATIFLTSEDEWYKAAYYDAVSTSYFDYPAGTDTQTVCAAPGATSNTANCGGVLLPPVGSGADVGSYTGSASPNGTFDQGGNASEWTEAITVGTGGSVGRIIRGGSGFVLVSNLAAFERSVNVDSSVTLFQTGFRLAAVPEPGAGLLLMMGMLGLAYRQRRRA